MVYGWTIALVLVGGVVATTFANEPSTGPPTRLASSQAEFQQFVESNCLDCHDSTAKTAGLGPRRPDRHRRRPESGGLGKGCPQALGATDAAAVMPRPGKRNIEAAIAWLESSLDAAAAAHPNPGRTETFRRLNRTEYQNAIRDLLALEVDVALAACRRMSRATGSTTSRSPISRRRC